MARLFGSILVTEDYPKSVIHEGFELIGQPDLFSARDKDFHRARRRLVSPAFGLAYLRTLEPIMQECIGLLIRKIDATLQDPGSANGNAHPQGHIDIYSLLNRLSFDIIGSSAFGQSFNLIENDTNPIIEQIAASLKRAWRQTFNPWMKYIIPVDYSFFNFAVERVRARRALGEKGRRSDLLQYLLDAQAREIEEGNGPTGNEAEDIRTGKLTNKAIEIEAFVFLIAGSETTSTALTWALLYLVKHQDKLKRLREEIDGATSGNPSNQLPKLEQVRKLPYLDAVLNESFRLRPVAATGIPREVPEDREMLGYKIPKGTICLAQIRQLHSDPLFFPKPDEFIPERWIPSESPFPPIQDFTFYPFSAGTRNCVGKNFAMMELRLILSAIVSTYDLEFIPGQNERYLQFITTVFVAGQYLISMKRRS
ncbi:hypothetical protein DFQ27_003718 [Actinomortierella ambigua]|uniref:Cytochrome P450 n=1 Tax=Actinomortierella ambigua TaxID=1343610 RepID=A0A9P6UCK0_9FUNG|nr:hypothetical protein DFQ27_003718 [Actinomortierella ambigua]